MLEALSAEALKMRRHKATWFLVWIYPILFATIMVVAIGAAMAGFDGPDHQELSEWVEDTAVIWFLPGNSFGRYLISAFVAVLFAGEYGWNTWKLVVPHRSRTALIGAKYWLALLLFAVAVTLTALLTTLLSFADGALTDDTIPEGVTAAGLWAVQSKAALAALAPTLVAIGYASLAAVLTRSTIAALVISIVVTTIEQLIFNFGPVLSVKFPGIAPALYHALPGYHIANLAEWIRDGVPLSVTFPSGNTVALQWTTSLATLVAWIAALYAAVFAAFRRQDIN
jgi:ABC-2 type transport system permease protein